MKTNLALLHWVPRILCLLAILFISMFALDSFEVGLSIWQQFAAFFMHLIPSFMLLGILFIAWKWEFVGGIIFMVIGLGLTPYIFKHNYQMNHSVGISLGIILMITFPFIVVGALFILSHYLKKKK